jgi:hypothetical protein
MMKRFLFRGLLFLVGVIVLLGLAEYMARLCPNAYRIKEDWMRGQAEQVETLVLGSSHTYAAIKPEHLGTKAYNLANSSQTQRYDWLLLQRDTLSLTSLKAIVYPSSSLLMDYRLEDTSEWYRCIYYQLYNHLEEHPFLSKYGWEVASMQTCCWKVQSLFISGESDRMCDENGWCTYYKARPSQRENLTQANADERIRKYAEREEIRSPKEDHFDEIAGFCQRHGLRLLLLSTPVSQVFRSHADASEYLKMTDKMAQEKASKYDCIEYRDYSNDARFTEDDFFDVDHLNSTGATKFTQIIRQDFAL